MSLDTYIYTVDNRDFYLVNKYIYICIYTFNELQTQKDSVDRDIYINIYIYTYTNTKS